jgi:hypothetical protein
MPTMAGNHRTGKKRRSGDKVHYDIIGDIHGHADALRRLLTKLCYRDDVEGVFRHPDRKAIFVGDYIDRGPQQRQALQIVRRMCDAGAAHAVMGNHEFNAIGWSLPDGKGGFLRAHSPRNAHQHAQFLREFPEGSEIYSDAISWFRKLPVWLEVSGLRIIHACWHEPSQAVLAACLDGGCRFHDDGLRTALTRGSEAYRAAEILLKGPEQKLPSGMHFADKDGFRREEIRLRWWDSNATTFRNAAIGFEDRAHELPEEELPCDYKCTRGPPVMFGHYWLTGEPTLTGLSAACLDFSVAKGGYLTCYRWSGEEKLRADHLVSVPAAE